jgi:Domain of unknown function (DUF1902)
MRKINIDVFHDDEANVYVATSPNLKGLVIEAVTLEELKNEVATLVPELLALNHEQSCQASIVFRKIDSEEKWATLFANSQRLLSTMAAEAIIAHSAEKPSNSALSSKLER